MSQLITMGQHIASPSASDEERDKDTGRIEDELCPNDGDKRPFRGEQGQAMCLQAVGLVVQAHGLDLAAPRLKVWPLRPGEVFVGRAWGPTSHSWYYPVNVRSSATPQTRCGRRWGLEPTCIPE